MINELLNRFFTRQLINWNSTLNKRAMPWKGEINPYKIWLSEIILQQTRVEQGMGFYNKFVANFPSIMDLAKASEIQIYKLWEGLGYYSRCKNLIHTAKFIAKEKKGIFPNTYEAILALKGVGPYTAAAIASFAFNLPYAVVDGNVYRVLARFFGIYAATDKAEGKKQFNQLAGLLLDKKQPGIYNQAIMDFGALVCKPKQPLCATCVLKKKCRAFQEQTVHLLPVKQKTPVKVKRYFYCFLATYRNKIYIRKREEADIWQNLYEFILLEQPRGLTKKKSELPYLFSTHFDLVSTACEMTAISKKYSQQLSHQSIEVQFVQVKLHKPLPKNSYNAMAINQIGQLPFPRLINAYLADRIA